MARNRNREPGDRPERGVLDERQRLLAAGALFVAVVLILVLGMVLRDDPPAETRNLATTALELPAPPETVELEPTVQDDPRPATLGPRAASDSERLRRSGGQFTVKLFTVCDPANAQRLVARAADASRLYLLPFSHNGKDCYRVCWGSYASRPDPDRLADLPAWLREESDGPRVRSISELVR